MRPLCVCRIAVVIALVGWTASLSGAVVLSSISPSQAAAGTSVSVTGTTSSFPAGTVPPTSVTVTITPSPGNGAPVVTQSTNVTTVLTSRQVFFTIPSALVVTNPIQCTVSISGTTSTGNAYTSNALNLVVNPPPSISNISPGVGSRGTSVPVVISGRYTNFQPTISSITFNPPGGITPTISAGSSGQLMATFVIDPLATPGARTVTVNTGTEHASLTTGFIVFASQGLSFSSISPNFGQQAQTLDVNLTGINTHFDTTNSVPANRTFANFGDGILVNTITALDATHAKANINIDSITALGARTVTLVTGGEFAISPNGFTVTSDNASVLSITPNAAPPSATLHVIVRGLGTHFLQNATTVTFGAGINVGNVQVTSPTSMDVDLAITSSAAVGLRDVKVTTGVPGVPNGGEIETKVGGFVVSGTATPYISGVSPSSAVQGTTLAIGVTGVGVNFLPALTADFGSDITVNSVVVGTATSATINVSIDQLALVGAHTVTLHNGVTTYTFTFVVTAAPAFIVSLDSSSGPQGGSPRVTVTGSGTHWDGTTTATLVCCQPDPASLTVSRVTVTNPLSLILDITIPANAQVAPYTLTLTTGGETVHATFSVYSTAPTLTISPGSGQLGTTVPVNLGSEFAHFCSATVNTPCSSPTTINIGGAGISITNFSVTSAESATAKFVIGPTATCGTVTMTTGTEIVTTSFCLTTTPAVLTAASINPNHSPTATTQIITIDGQATHFDASTAVGFGPNISVNSVTVTSPTHLTASVTVNNGAAYGWRLCFVNTGAEQLQIGFHVDSPGSTMISSVTPEAGQQGQVISGVVIIGQNTHWVAGNTQLILGPGITVQNLQVANATTLICDIAVSPTAVLNSAPSIVVITSSPSEVVGGASFGVQKGVAQILTLSPNQVAQNQTLTVSLAGQATHWLQGGTTADFGSAIAVNQLTITSATQASAQITILSTADLGLRTVTLQTDGEAASIAQGLDIVQGTPTLLSSTPNAGIQGTTENIQVLGRFTHWQQGVTTASYSSEIIVNSVTVLDSITATLNITVKPLAATGCGTGLTLTTGGEQVSLGNQFCIGLGPAQILDVEPNSSLQGATLSVHVTGVDTHFTAGLTTASFGAGINATVHVTSSTTADVELAVSAAATPGIRGLSLSTLGESASLANAFTVIAGNPTLNGVSPVSGLQGTTVPVHILAQFTHWTQGVTTATFGQGITLVPNSLVIGLDGQSADATLMIDQLASLGGRTFTFTTGSEIVSGSFFSVTSSSAIIVGVSPSSGNQGQEKIVAISGQGTHWAQGLTQFSILGLDTGIAVKTFVVTSPTTANVDFLIDPSAKLGARTILVSTGGEVLKDTGAFVVTGGIASIANLTAGVSGSGGQQGATNLNVTINGILTNWTAAATQSPDFGPGITVTNYTVNSSTSLTAVINIDPAAAIGVRDVTIRTGSQLLTGSFEVLTSAPPPGSILSFGPGAGLPGQTLDLTFIGKYTHWDLTTTISTGVAGIHVNSFQVTDPTTALANITIDPLATAGPRTITLTKGSEMATAIFAVIVDAMPSIIAIDPGSALQGETSKNINLIGQYTAWDNTTTFDFGAGITMNGPVNVLGKTIAMANIAVAQLATLGNRPVTATTGTHVDTGCCLSVTPSLANIQIVTPNTALQNDTPTVSVTGQFTHWTNSTTFSFDGSGISVTTTAVTDATHATLTLAVAPLAGVGSHGISAVTGGEVATLANAFVVQPGTPLILSSSPLTIQQQAALNVTILGQFTNWQQGVTTVSFGPVPGITVGAATVAPDGLAITASISASPTAVLGTRTLTVTTGSQVLSLPGAISLVAGPAAVTLLSPNHATQGQTTPVAITGTNTNFIQGVTMADFGPGITVNSLTVTGPHDATASITVAPNATQQVNTVTLTTLGEQASDLQAFTIISASLSAFNAVNDFTPLANPNGAWSYGWKPALNGAFTLYTVTDTSSVVGVAAWLLSGTWPNSTPYVARNSTGNTLPVGSFHVPADELHVHPGPGGQYTVTRWTAPATGFYTVAGLFEGLDSATTDVHILQNGASGVFDSNLNGNGTTIPFNLTLGLAAGDTLDFAVGFGSNGNAFDSTGLKATITPTAPPPVTLTSVTPNHARRGTNNVSLAVTGSFTHFNAATTASFSAGGISVVSVTLSSNLQATVVVDVDAAAALGARDLTFTTGAEVASLASAFTVDPAVLSVTTTSLPVGTTGVAYNQTIAISGGLAPFTYTLTGTLPTNLVFNSSNATIFGLPAAPATATLVFHVSDSSGQSASANDTLTIYNPLLISPGTLPPGLSGVTYSQTLTSSGGAAPRTFSVSAGSLPNGLMLDATSGLLSGLAGTGCLAVPSGLAGWWSGDGNAADRTGGSNGIVSGTVPFGPSYKVGSGAFNFNGSGYVKVPSTPALEPAHVTVSAWVNVAAAGPNGYVIDKNANGGAAAYAMYALGGQLQFYISPAGGGFALSPATNALSDLAFHHVVGTYDGSFVRLFVDGVEVGTGTPTTGNIAYSADPNLYIGTYLGTNGQFSWHGAIDEVQIFDHALTATEIHAMYAAGGAGQCTPGIIPASGAGTYNFTTRVSDNAGQHTDQPYSVTIYPALAFTTTSLPSGRRTFAYDQTIVTTGGIPSTTLSIVSGSLPNGLDLNPSTGEITGTPTQFGSFNIQLQLTDSAGNFVQQSYTLVIADILSIASTSPLATSVVGSSYSQTIASANGVGAVTFAITSGTLPDSLQLNTATGEIFGVPSVANTFNFTIQATDTLNLTVSRQFSIITLPTPLITNIGPNHLITGQIMSLVLTGQNTHWSASTTASFGAGVTVNSITATPNGLGATISVTIAQGAAGGTRDVTMTTPQPSYTEIATALAGVTVSAGPPSIALLSPAGAQVNTTATVTITGQNLLGAAFAFQNPIPGLSNVPGPINIVSNDGTTVILGFAAGSVEGQYALIVTTTVGATPNNAAAQFVVQPTGPRSVVSPGVSVLNVLNNWNTGPAIPAGSNTAESLPVTVLNILNGNWNTVGSIPPGSNTAESRPVSILNILNGNWNTVPSIPAGSNTAESLPVSILNILFDPALTYILPSGRNSISALPVSVCNVASGCVFTGPSAQAIKFQAETDGSTSAANVSAGAGSQAGPSGRSQLRSIVEGRTLLLDASSIATDGAAADFAVNGVTIAHVTQAPYQALFTVPASARELNFSLAVQLADGRQLRSVPVTVSAVPDSGSPVELTRLGAGETATLLGSGLRSEYFAFNQPLTAIPSLDGLAPARSGYVTAVNQPNPSGLFGPDPLGSLISHDFVARFSGDFWANGDGGYRFWATAHSGAQILIDGKPVAESGFAADSSAVAEGEVSLSRGWHHIEMRYVFAAGPESVLLEWQQPGGARGVIAPNFLRTELTGVGAQSVPAMFDSVWVRVQDGKNVREQVLRTPVQN